MIRALFWEDLMSQEMLLAYDVVYVGNEFCEKRMPTDENLRGILTFCEAHEKKIVLVTPYLTDAGMATIERIIAQICEAQVECEIVVNDWGFLQRLRGLHDSLGIVLGRLIVSRYMLSEHLQTAATFQHVFPDAFFSLLKELGISKIEFNSYAHLKYCHSQVTSENVSMHVYSPYVYTTTSRYCSAARGFSDYLREPDGLCNQECVSLYADMYQSQFSAPLRIDGNTYFVSAPAERDYEQFVDRLIDNSNVIGCKC